MGKYELEVTTFQMAVLFAWNQRPEDLISFESLRQDTPTQHSRTQITTLPYFSRSSCSPSHGRKHFHLKGNHALVSFLLLIALSLLFLLSFTKPFTLMTSFRFPGWLLNSRTLS